MGDPEHCCCVGEVQALVTRLAASYQPESVLSFLLKYCTSGTAPREALTQVSKEVFATDAHYTAPREE